MFVYAREHPSIEYRQGMHELLAPLIFVIHCDQQTCAHACEVEESVPAFVKLLLEEKSLEPDAYDMFCHVMDIMEPLYQYGDQSPGAREAANSGSSSMTNSTEGPQRTIPTEPFQNKEEPERLACTSAINKKLRYVHENILMSQDHELYTHLERLDIAPQIYGLRWVRLLFGREFPLQVGGIFCFEKACTVCCTVWWSSFRYTTHKQTRTRAHTHTHSHTHTHTRAHKRFQ